MDEPRKKSWTRTEVIVASLVSLLLFALLLSLSMPRISGPGKRGHIMKSIAHCRQIILSIRLYAADHDGAYPDSKVPSAMDSNTVLRQLVVEGALEDEKIFGCSLSPFKPDGNIGSKPDYIGAVEPGENHWSMTRGLNDKSPGGIPLVYENPVEATWPPTWNADAADMPVKGRARKNGNHCMIIVGFNDTSVEAMVLASKTGTRVAMPKNKDPFAVYPREPGNPNCEVLDVAVKN